MSIFSIFTLLGGLSFFLYGMKVMSGGLEKAAGGKLETILKKMTSNPFKSLLLGAGITIAIQSSSAMTVMLVGLVNSGIMTLRQTIGVIMGSNVGTTLTAWILSMSSIESSSILIRLLKPDSFAPILGTIGIIMIMTAKHSRKRDLGNVFIGFWILMCGMNLMSSAMSPLKDMPGFADFLTAFNNPLLGVLVGAVFTGIIQSSAASVGILQALSLSGDLTFGMALPIIMGQNIGTCVTSLLSSIGVNRNAKKVTVVHIAFNLIGTFVCLLVFYGANIFFHFAFLNDAIDSVGIAACHTLFNVITTMLLFPFCRQLENLANFLIKNDGTEEKDVFIDERLLKTPSVAVTECMNLTSQMGEIAHSTVTDAIHLLDQYDDKKADSILANEDILDRYEDKLGSYLVKVSTKNISSQDSRNVSKMLHIISDFERFGDHAVNFLESAQEMRDKKLAFSDDAVAELQVLSNALCEILQLTTTAYIQDDISLASQVEPLEQVIDNLVITIRGRHVERLQRGECTIQLGFILSDLLHNFERLSDCCSNIAVAIIEIDKNHSFATHKYLNHLKNMKEENFNRFYDSYSQKYSL